MQRVALSVVDRSDTQLVQFVVVVVLSTQLVLDGWVPVEFGVGGLGSDGVAVGTGLSGEDSALGQLGVFDEVGSGLTARLGREEHQSQGESAGCGLHQLLRSG